jgi:D-aminopeptidase
MLADPMLAMMRLGTEAANVVARAIARGVYEATAHPSVSEPPAYRDTFP